MTRNSRITVRLDEICRNRIDQRIKLEYPRLRTVSDVIREALQQYFAKLGA